MLRSRPSLPVFMLASVVCSELVWIIRSDAKLEDIPRDLLRKKDALNAAVEKRKLGIDAELPSARDQSLEEIIKSLDLKDTLWAQSTVKPEVVPKSSVETPKPAERPAPRKGGWI